MLLPFITVQTYINTKEGTNATFLRIKFPPFSAKHQMSNQPVNEFQNFDKPKQNQS